MKRLLKKCIILSFIMSLFSAISGSAMAGTLAHRAKTEITEDTKIAIYQFYYNPFGYRCNKSKTYVADLLVQNKKFKDIPFNVVNVQDQAPEKLIEGYTSPKKAVVIVNLKTKNFRVSKIRDLITLGWTKQQIHKVLIEEIESVM
jgi:hypothetical protein